MIDTDEYEEPECEDECTCEARCNWAMQEVKRLHYWIYHHAKNLDAGGVHTFADEAREVIGLVKGEVRDYEHR